MPITATRRAGLNVGPDQMIRVEHLVLLAISEVPADSSLTYPDGGPRERSQASNDADIGLWGAKRDVAS